MYFVTVEWMDGRTESYPAVPRCEARDGLLNIAYELESHIIPLANVRIWKVENQ